MLYFCWSEHEPIHVHAKNAELESKAEFFIVNGIISEIKIVGVRGKLPLNGNDLKNFKVFLQNYANQIVQKWVDYFVYHKEVPFEKITKKLK